MSHPHATAQCQSFLRAHAPGAEIVAANSTADAVRIVGTGDDPTAAAIGTLRAAELYGGEVIARDIADTGDNSTRFVLIGTEPAEALGPGRLPHLDHLRPPARPPRRAAVDPPGVRAARGQPDQAGEPAHQDRARALHVLHRHRGQPRPRSAGGLGHPGPRGAGRDPCHIPRVLPRRGRSRLESPRARGERRQPRCSRSLSPTRNPRSHGAAGPRPQRHLRAHQRVLAAARGGAGAEGEGRGARARRAPAAQRHRDPRLRRW